MRPTSTPNAQDHYTPHLGSLPFLRKTAVSQRQNSTIDHFIPLMCRVSSASALGVRRDVFPWTLGLDAAKPHGRWPLHASGMTGAVRLRWDAIGPARK